MRFHSFVLVLAAGVFLAAPGHADTVLRVMTFNIWGGGANDGKPVDETAAAIRAAGADIVGIQESRQEATAMRRGILPAGERERRGQARGGARLPLLRPGQVERRAVGERDPEPLPDRRRNATRPRRRHRRRRAARVCIQHPPHRLSVPALPAGRHPVWLGAVPAHRGRGGERGRSRAQAGHRPAHRGPGGRRRGRCGFRVRRLQRALTS